MVCKNETQKIKPILNLSSTVSLQDIQKVRQYIQHMAPPTQYGYGGYYVNPNYSIAYIEQPEGEAVLFINGETNLSIGYNCGLVNGFLNKFLQESGLSTDLYSGDDEDGIMGRDGHYFCVDSDGMVWDGTPVYSIYGSSHSPNKKDRSYTSKNPIKFVDNPLGVFTLAENNCRYLLSVSSSFINKDEAGFTLKIVNTNSRVETSYKISVGLQEYRRYYQEGSKEIYDPQKIDELYDNLFGKFGLAKIQQETNYTRNNNGDTEQVIHQNAEKIIPLLHKIVYAKKTARP